MLRKIFVVAGLIAAAMAGVVSAASAKIVAKVDLADQEMQVYVDGKLRHSWPVATGRRGFETPTGNFRPQRLEREWYSTKYDDAPMPNAVFFHGGYAVHGSGGPKGSPRSHGCVRLDHGNARAFYNLVSAHGAGQTRIVISR